MHGSILVLAKKKAAGPGGYFDPMEGPAPMAMGPMVFQVSEESAEPEGEDEGEYDVKTADKAKGAPVADLKTIIADLKAAAMKLDKIAMSGGELGAEDEPTGEEEPMAEAKPAPKAKKPFPGFGVKKEMKY
jgi:hypothetical protein